MGTLATAAQAQVTSRARAEAIVISALASAKAGDTAQALKLLDDARDTDDNYAPAHFHRGILLARTSTMGFSDIPRRFLAVRSLNRSLELDKDNPYALLELGRLRLKMPFMRIAAEGLFEKALAAAERRGDPGAVAEVNFEIGQIFDRRFRAVANRHMMTGSVDILSPGEAQYDKTYVENFLKQSAMPIPASGEMDAAKAASSYRAALAANPGHEGAAASLGTILYETHRYDEMARIEHAAGVASPGSARVRLAEGLALLRLGQFGRASEVLEKAVTLLSEAERQTIASLAPLMVPGDAARYETLDAAARVAYERNYWNAADPLLLTPINEMRLAFLGRVAYADLNFSLPDLAVRGALTDRGKIVLRYGEPPVVATFAPQTTARDDAETVARVTTLWWYPESRLRFVFIGPPAMNSAWFAGDFHQYSEELRVQQPAIFSSYAGNLTVDSIPMQIARFRGDQMLSTRVEMYAGVPASRLAAGSGLQSAPIETAFMIADGGQRRVVDQRDTVVTAADSSKRSNTRTWARQFRPGEYGYRVEALEPQAMRSARATGTFSIRSFPTGEFALSDLLIGTGMQDVMSEPKRRDDVQMYVLPDNSLDLGQTLALYWESYGARPTAEGTVRVRISIALTVLNVERAPVFHAKFLGAFADKLGVSQQGERTVNVSYDRITAAPASTDDRLLHSINIQLDQAPAAEYLLELTMTDLESGRTAKSSRMLHVRRAQ